MSRRELSEKERAYIACAIDTEGGVELGREYDKRYKRHYYNLKVRIVNSNKEFLQRIAKMIGAGNIVERKTDKWHKRPIYVYQIPKANLMWLIPQILDETIIKKRRLELLLEFLKDDS